MWEARKIIDGIVKAWRVSERVAWIGLVLSYLMPLRVPKLFAEDISRVYVVYCLRREYVFFYTDEWQM